MNIILINARAAGFQLQCRQAGSFAAQLRNKSLCAESRTVTSTVSRFVCFIVCSFLFLSFFVSVFIFYFLLLFFYFLKFASPFLSSPMFSFCYSPHLFSSFYRKWRSSESRFVESWLQIFDILIKTFYWFSSVQPDKFRAGTKTPDHHPIIPQLSKPEFTNNSVIGTA